METFVKGATINADRTDDFLMTAFLGDGTFGIYEILLQIHTGIQQMLTPQNVGWILRCTGILGRHCFYDYA
jgi:hypothetical protein